MVFHGLQKLTLLDYPGRVACTIFTAGCNFRCPFCHNAVLVERPSETEVFTDDEIIAFLKKRSGILDGICITGGEPLLNPDIIGFMRRVRELGLDIKLDSNGSRFELLKDIISEKLVDYIAMDIKNSPEKYAFTAGLDELDMGEIEKSRDLIMSCGIDYEFRTTAVDELHTAADIEAAAEWIKGAKRYFIQNFVDSGDLILPGLSACSKEKMAELLASARKHVTFTELRGV